MKLRTEQLLTSPQGFGIVTATPAQRAACRILDGFALAELRDHPDVVALVGGSDARDQLHTERGSLPLEVVFLASIRSAKTIIAAAAAIRMTQTVDCSRLGPGEIPRVSLLSLRLDQSAVAHRLLLETIKASSVLSKLLIAESAESLTLRHPSGRPVEVANVAGGKAGGTLVARWSAGLIADEAPRMSGADDAVVNLEHARSAILGRLLPGAQALYIGSPWAPYGPVYELVQQHWQKPSEHLVVLRGTGPALNPIWWTPERCRKLEAQDPTAYATDVMGEFADPESGLLSPISIRANTREGPHELPPLSGSNYVAAVDPSEGAAGGNGFSLAIVQHLKDPDDEQPRFRVVLTREWRGVRPADCWQQIAGVCKTYGLSKAVTDQHAAASNTDLARLYGLYLDVDKATGTSKLEDFTNLATLIHGDRVELSPCPILRRDLLSVKRRVTQDGARIILPRTSDGRHADAASALCAAVKHANTAARVTWDPRDCLFSGDNRHAPVTDRRFSLFAPDDDDDDWGGSSGGGRWGGL